MARCPLIAQALKTIDSTIDLTQIGFLEAAWRSTVRNSDLPECSKKLGLEAKDCRAAVFPRNCQAHELVLAALILRQ